MLRYVGRRLVALIPVWLGIAFVAFVVNTLTPGDPARLILQQRSGDPPTEEEVAALRDELGLDDPLPLQYVRYVRAAASGDLGASYRTSQPILPELLRRFRVTLELALPAFALGLALAVPLGVVAAARANRWPDHVSRLTALAGASVPSFWLAYLFILLFAVRLRLLPVAGRASWAHLVLPVVTLAIAATAGLARLTRASMLEAMGETFVTTAKAKGLPSRRVLGRHALRNALIPIVTLAGLRLGNLLAGAVIVETVFAWPGLGKYVVDAIYERDYPVIQAFVLFVGTVFLLLNLLIDVLYVRIDPRVRLEPARVR